MQKVISAALFSILLMAAIDTAHAAIANSDNVRQKLTAGHIQFTEKTEEDAARMKNANAIAKATKFKVLASNGHHITIVVMELKDPAKEGALKAEVQSQFDAVTKIAANKVARIMTASPTTIVTISYNKPDQVLASQVEKSLQ